MENLSDASFLGKLVVLQANVRLDCKVIVSANTLAYLASLTVMKKKMFYDIDTWCQCHNNFFLHHRRGGQNKLDRLSLEIGLMFASKAGAYLSELNVINFFTS